MCIETIVIDKIGDFFDGQMVEVSFHFTDSQSHNLGHMTNRFWCVDDVFFDNNPDLNEYIKSELKEKFNVEVSFS